MKYRALVASFLALCLGFFTVCGSAWASPDRGYTYDEILNTGLANKCPQISEFTRGAIDVTPGQVFTLSDLCLEPQEYFVKEEPVNKRREAEFVAGKVLTRYTSSLEQMTGEVRVNNDGTLTLVEQDGIDFQPVTIQLPGGKQVPFLFTIKGLSATTDSASSSINTSTDFVGTYRVPSYRGSVFLDPKARGLSSGYDNAVALPSQSDSGDYNRANVKQYVTGQGKISLQIAKVDKETGEIAGTFESEQPSSTDMGAEDPEEVRVRGIFYGRVQPAA